jgi:hypothetical protein
VIEYRMVFGHVGFFLALLGDGNRGLRNYGLSINSSAGIAVASQPLAALTDQTANVHRNNAAADHLGVA